MINYNFIKFYIVILLMIPASIILAQSKYGTDEQACKENVSVFKENCKQKNYIDALNPWRWAYNNCPASYATIYKNGPKIIKAVMKKNPEKKSQYIDTLMMIFDQRIKYGFGKEGYILGLKGYELFLIDKSRAQEAHDIIQQSIDMDGNSSSVQAVLGYMKSIVYLEGKGKKSKEDVLSVYSKVNSIVEYNVLNESKTTKNFIKYSEKIEELFTPYASCSDLVLLFSEKYSSSENDIESLKRIEEKLSKNKCKTNELYINVLKKIQEIEDSSYYAFQLALALFSNKKFSESSKVLKQMLDMYDLTDEYKVNLYLVLANSLRMEKKYSQAIANTEKALKIKPNLGEAYMLQGNIYVSGLNLCGNEFERTTIYWIAVDCFVQASKDSKTKDLAIKSINTYSKYFPDKETCFFNGVQAGSKYSIGCWINRKTIVRTTD